MLLDQFPHVIRVYVAQQVLDSYDNEIIQPASEAIDVPCRLSPMSTSNDVAASRVDGQFKVIASYDAQLVELSRAEFNGSNYIVSNVLKRNDSDATRHTSATLREES